MISEEEQKQRMLASMLHMHEQLAAILAYKALEAEKARNWICNCLPDGDALKPCMSVHEQMVEMLEGITRVESGIVSHLKLLFGEASAQAGGIGALLAQQGED